MPSVLPARRAVFRPGCPQDGRQTSHTRPEGARRPHRACVTARTTDPDELEREIAAETGADLAPPGGVLLVARYGGRPAGTAGVRLTDPATAELKRVFLRGDMRGRGGARLLVTAAEDHARALGARQMILDTRRDLVEARALYARLGYVETEPHNDEPYADHWFGKRLAPLPEEHGSGV
ncbi:GNAT family N-acetyltransferase [Streptomyces sp. NPDC003480]